MLWYKSWLDTRWRFLLGLALLLVFACGTVITSRACRSSSLVPPRRRSSAARHSARSCRSRSRACARSAATPGRSGSRANFPALLTLFAALLGSGSPLVKSGSGALFSLALPVSRGRWIGTRAGAGLPSCSCSRLRRASRSRRSRRSSANILVRSTLSSSASARSSWRACSSRSRCSSRRFQRRLAAAADHVSRRRRDRRSRHGSCRRTAACSRRWPAVTTSTAARCRGPSCSSARPPPADSFTPPRRTSRGGISDRFNNKEIRMCLSIRVLALVTALLPAAFAGAGPAARARGTLGRSDPRTASRTSWSGRSCGRRAGKLGGTFSTPQRLNGFPLWSASSDGRSREARDQDGRPGVRTFDGRLSADGEKITGQFLSTFMRCRSR